MKEFDSVKSTQGQRLVMVLTEITEEIKCLSRFEKLQLMEAISRMLLEEEDPTRYVVEKAVYPVFTPTHQEKAAAQLQQFLTKEFS